MIAVRVNLLRMDELRYQGAVSREFGLRALAGGVLALVLLLVLLSVVKQRNLRHELALLREGWSALEPRYARARLVQEELDQGQALQNELAAWHASRLEWSSLLDELQQVVPPEVQLTKLSVRSELGLLQSEPGAEGDPTAPASARKFSLRMDGKTSGDLADEVVVQFANTLRNAEGHKAVMESIKLQGLQRSTADKGQGLERLFGIEGTSTPRTM